MEKEKPDTLGGNVNLYHDGKHHGNSSKQKQTARIRAPKRTSCDTTILLVAIYPKIWQTGC